MTRKKLVKKGLWPWADMRAGAGTGFTKIPIIIFSFLVTAWNYLNGNSNLYKK